MAAFIDKPTIFKNLKHSGFHASNNFVVYWANIKFDLNWIRECGFDYDGHVYDTMVAEYLLARARKWPLSLDALAKRYEVTEGGYQGDYYILNMTDDNAAKLKNNPIIKSISKDIASSGTYDARIFPHNPQYAWSIDNYGPIYIPEKGKTVALTKESLPFYKQIITEYEKNDLPPRIIRRMLLSCIS